MTDVSAFLDRSGIPYERHDHAPVYTVEEALRHVPPLPGARLKNLFLCDRKGKRHFLVAVGFDKRVDLKSLARIMEVSHLRFGSPGRLREKLALEPGSVSLLAVVNDSGGAVEVVIDRGVWEQEAFQCHPLVNTSTLVIARNDMERFFTLTGHRPRFLDVPREG
ncbi:MAG: prolyl-tRNA synthetase associated domain-containing protein [Deltaproteobacteria bacterium]|nr:prolyl-tRNA synthetase associated domain-containing protein [Deltaproteobacteria bacterium]